MTVLALSVGQWVIIGLAGLIALAGFGLMAVNLLAILRPRQAGEEGPPRKLLGKPTQLTRRAFFRRALGATFGIATLEGLGLTSLAMLWPDLSGGFGGEIVLSDSVDIVKEQIRSTRTPYYFGPGRFYLVEYDESDDSEAIYTKDGLLAGGLAALYQRCVHLGCRVPFCETSQWFECPCHGSKYNRSGEYKAGPAPRGLDRFPMKVENGVVTVNTGVIITGPPRGTNTTGQEAEGPFCLAAGSE